MNKIETIDAQIKALQEKKIKVRVQQNRKKRKLENRCKYLLGAYFLMWSSDFASLKAPSEYFSDTDKITLMTYDSNILDELEQQYDLNVSATTETNNEPITL